VAALDGTCRPDVASDAAAKITEGGGLDPSEVRVEVECDAGRTLERDGVVTARVTVDMPAVAVPLVGSVGAWKWTAAHREPVDPYGSRP
jgi:hypothetical protein